MKLLSPLNKQLTEKPFLYRIELLDRFFNLLDKKELVFVRPQCWSDPLENLLFNASLIKNGKAFEHPAKKNIYGQCWSYEGDSYALWQIYTTKKNDKGQTARHTGIRITTHLNRLKQISKQNKGQFYYGLVNYMWKKDLEQLMRDKDFIKGLKRLKLSKDHIKTLLVKRRSYAYEQELRLLVVPDKKHVDPQQDFLCRLKIEPTDFISSLRLDPALSYAEFRKIKERLVDEYGFAPTKITHSTLGKHNDFVIDLDKV